MPVSHFVSHFSGLFILSDGPQSLFSLCFHGSRPCLRDHAAAHVLQCFFAVCQAAGVITYLCLCQTSSAAPHLHFQIFLPTSGRACCDQHCPALASTLLSRYRLFLFFFCSVPHDGISFGTILWCVCLCVRYISCVFYSVGELQGGRLNGPFLNFPYKPSVKCFLL